MNAKESLEKKIKYEMKEFVTVFLYLVILIGSFTVYRWLLMAEYHVGYFVYGYTLIEALVLAKLIIIGESLGIGERFSNQPLIVPTLYKTLIFALFVLAFAILELLVKGFLHGKDMVEVFQGVIRGRYEILSRILIMFVALIPFFAFGEAERALKEVNLFELFFRRREPVASDTSQGSPPPA